jgi:ribosomal protein L3
MSQFFDEEGKSIPVTLIEAGPCRITQLNSEATDGYTAVQLGFGETREKLVNKPAKGHLAKSGEAPLRHLKEYRLEAIDGGLQQLRRQIDRQWPSTEASDAAMATAIEPLDEAIDQIERSLDAGTA